VDAIVYLIPVVFLSSNTFICVVTVAALLNKLGCRAKGIFLAPRRKIKSLPWGSFTKHFGKWTFQSLDIY